MDSHSHPSYLIIEHSYICRLVDFCDGCNLSSFGSHSCFCTNALALPEATLSNLPPVVDQILSRSRDVLFFYFGSFDLLAASIPFFSIACAFHASLL